MINKQALKRKMPGTFNFIKRQPHLLKLARKVDNYLVERSFHKSRNLGTHYTSEQINQLLIMAKERGLFNYEWYSQQQKRKFSCELEAFEHYLTVSFFSNVDPSPAFDTELYYKCNTDIYLLGENALVHYLTYGINEGRVSPPSSISWHPEPVKSSNESDCTPLKIAMCFHIFYEEFIDYYCNSLVNFPQTVDVFISVANDELAKKAELAFSRCEKVDAIKIKVSPNQGRNFGPLLVEFSTYLERYDLFCHMHSKKSLYSGRVQTQWADYLGEYLLKDHHVIKQVLNHFQSNPKVGIYYPTSFWMMPDWVNHWLKNKPYGKKFADEWGIEINSDFIPYPVGGMFWARPDALRQLLDKEYSYDDFPSEPLPNDGSELHALERMLGLLAEKNDYKQLFYYPKTSCLTVDKGYVTSHYVNNSVSLRNHLERFEHISFDVFDTLVRRRYFAPDYAKLLLGKDLTSLGYFDSEQEFVKLRNEAEFNVRKSKGFSGDVTIFETYDFLANVYGWSSEQAKNYAEKEFYYDLSMIQPKNEIVDLLNELVVGGRQVTIISDTYYTKDQVSLMLAKVGVSCGYELFVSSELGMRKDNGTLWQYVKDLLPKGQLFIHVGDNAVADAQIPGDFGLQNLHILNPIDKWSAAGFANFSDHNFTLNESEILKWGSLVSDFGRFPFLGE
ncbi:rhamnan synthesis F family protein [Pseudoalteromonas lipolytica]